MSMKKILVPTDFSQAAGQAIEFASLIAQSWPAEITLLSVYTPAVSRYNMSVRYWWTKLRKRSRDQPKAAANNKYYYTRNIQA
jgi:nucleotide-binding universal stress UspA family protein